MPERSSPLPKLHLGQKNSRTESAGVSTIFFGLAFRFENNKREYAVAIHDGMGLVGSEMDMLEGDIPDDLIDRIIQRAREYSVNRGHKVGLP